MSDSFTRALRAAAAATAPIFFGYVFVGMAFGLLLQKTGYGVLWAFLSSLTVYSGSMQFVLVGLLAGWPGFLHVIVVTIAVQIRHAFYGLSLIEAFKGLGVRKLYLIFAFTDETYSLFCSIKPPEATPRGRFYLMIALLNQCYWVAGGVIGATVGELIPFDSTGIDFAMTALFIVIFVEQWLDSKTHIPALAGLGCALVCLLLFGADGFLPPALLLTVGVLLAGRRPLEKRLDGSREGGDAICR